MKQLVTVLGEEYLMSQKEVADKLFIHVNTVASDEKKAIEKFKQIFFEHYKIEDYL